MLTGYLATLPTDCLLSAGVLFCTKNATTTRIGVTDGPPDFDDNSELGEIMFDNRAPSRLKGLSRTNGFSPLLKGTLKEFGLSASGNQIAILEPGETEVTASGVTTATPKPTGLYFASGEYIVDLRWVFERSGGGYACIYAPLAICRKWSAKGADKKEAQFAFEFEAVGDPINDLGTAPYVIELRTQLPTTQDEVAFLRSNIIGGDSGMLAVYSPRYNLGASAGKVTQWDDARGGVGFGPSLTPDTGGNGLSISGTDVNTYLLRSDAGRKLQSPLTSLFDLSTTKTLVLVGKAADPPSHGSDFPVNIADDAAANLLGFDEAEASVPSARVGVLINPGVTHITSDRSRDGKLRLFVMRVSGTTGGLQVPPVAEKTATVSAPTAGNNRLRFGFSTAGNVDETYRAALVLNHVPSAAEVTALVRWARVYHSSVTGSGKLMVTEGDSLTYGSNASSMIKNWPSQLTAGVFYADVDDAMMAIASATLQPGSSGGNNLPARASAVDAMYDPTRTRNVLTVWAGTNDLAVLLRTGAQTLTDLWSYCDARRAAGWRVIVLTCIPRNCGAGQTTFDTERGTLNTGINSAWASHADGKVDLTTLSAFNTNGAWSNATNYGVDGIHLTDVGYGLVAGAVDPVAQSLLT